MFAGRGWQKLVTVLRKGAEPQKIARNGTFPVVSVCVPGALMRRTP